MAIKSAGGFYAGISAIRGASPLFPRSNEPAILVRKNPKEWEEQAAVFDWWKNAYPKHIRLFHHSPMEGERKVVTGVFLKRQGMQCGYPDIAIAIPRGPFHGLYIELKVPPRKPTPEQLQMLKELSEQGYLAVICNGADAAIDQISNYMALSRA